MTQDALLILLFRIVIIADLIAVAAFVLTYTVLAAWWRDIIGRTIVTKDILLGLALIPTLLGLFFHFNDTTSRLSAWIDVVLFAGIAATMAWRCVIWTKIHRAERNKREITRDPGRP
jgi:hypothetical protein